MSITTYRKRYKPFEYQWAWETYIQSVLSTWNPFEVSFASDTVDWANLPKHDKKLIGGILRAFTLIETFVSCYWSDRVTKLFPKHEIVAMARYFSSQEINHAWAYSMLSDTLGIDEWEAYKGDLTAQAKVNTLVDRGETLDDNIVSLGIFSGAVEGVSLISSFVVLLSYAQAGQFKGLNQILSWSNIDELNHCKAGCKLFNELDKEGKVNNKHKTEIIKGFDLILKNEEVFLKNAYKDHPNPPIPLSDIIHYTKYLANTRLQLLNINHRYEYLPSKVQPIIDLYETQMKGVVSTDFFAMAKSGASYVAKPPQFSEELCWESLCNKLNQTR